MINLHSNPQNVVESRNILGQQNGRLQVALHTETVVLKF